MIKPWQITPTGGGSWIASVSLGMDGEESDVSSELDIVDRANISIQVVGGTVDIQGANSLDTPPTDLHLANAITTAMTALGDTFIWKPLETPAFLYANDASPGEVEGEEDEPAVTVYVICRPVKIMH